MSLATLLDGRREAALPTRRASMNSSSARNHGGAVIVVRRHLAMGCGGQDIVARTAKSFEDVFVNHEGLIFRRARIYPESFVAPLYATHFNRRSRYAWFLVKNYGLRRGFVRVPTGLWVIDNFSHDSYHHWLVDCLPRVLQAREAFPREHSLLLPRSYSEQPYVHFTLQAFPQIERIGWIGARAKVRVKRLAYVPRPPVYLGRPPIYLREQIEEIARRVGDLTGQPTTIPGIYFSRADAARRRAINERDVVRALRSYDFEIMVVDRNKPWEQMQASRGARVMVGVHGAALSNLIFMPPQSTVIELRRPDRAGVFFFDHYRPLANSVGVRHRAQLCEPANDAVGYGINDVDLVVDVDLLRENLRWASGQSSSSI